MWTESSHEDFSDGREYHYLGGDTATLWDTKALRTWLTGSRIYSPFAGGLRIIGQDLDIDDDGFLDLPVASWCIGPSLVYWGPDLTESSEINPGGLPSMWANGIFIADITGDGNPELLVANEVTNENPLPSSYIFTYAGGRRFELLDSIPYPYSIGAQGIQPADLNRDGVLDLVVANAVNHENGNWEVNSYILYGLSPSGKTFYPCPLPSFGGHPTVIADLNGDGFLDIVFPSNATNTTGWEGNMIIYWGNSAGTYGTWDTSWFPVSNNWESQVADLDRNGWLDIVAVNGKDNQGYYTKDRIFWGMKQVPFTDLPGIASSNITVYDVNLDGHLDMLISNWAKGTHGAETLQAYSYLLYGPDYIWGPKDSFPTFGAHGNMIADWNEDGLPDVFIGNEMASWGQYCPWSFVYWNSPHGFDISNRKRIDVWAPNDCVWTDLGNIYDRTPTERYLSSQYIPGKIICSLDSAKIFGEIPGDMSVSVWVRAGRGACWGPWIRMDEQGMPTGPAGTGDRLQYRLVIGLDYKTTTLFRIDSVKVFYQTDEGFAPTRELVSENTHYDSEIYDASGRLVGRGEDMGLPRGIYFRITKKGNRIVSDEAILK
ncbi:MAG: VCBS repeat-containing protein [candidate division WOR-3 bacterium]